MSIWLNDRLDRIDVDKVMQTVSAERRRKAGRYCQEHDRRQSLAVYLLLCEALEKEYGITSPPEFVYGLNGKPALKDYPDIHFNLSHCPRAALCVTSDSPVGCDIEEVPDKLDMDVCRYCFNEQEVAHITEADHPPLAFTMLWTKKEAYIKFTGEGLRDLPTLLTSSDIGDICFDTHVAPDNSYLYTVCQRRNNHSGR